MWRTWYIFLNKQHHFESNIIQSSILTLSQFYHQCTCKHVFFYFLRKLYRISMTFCESPKKGTKVAIWLNHNFELHFKASAANLRRNSISIWSIRWESAGKLLSCVIVFYTSLLGHFGKSRKHHLEWLTELASKDSWKFNVSFEDQVRINHNNRLFLWRIVKEKSVLFNSSFHHNREDRSDGARPFG